MNDHINARNPVFFWFWFGHVRRMTFVMLREKHQSPVSLATQWWFSLSPVLSKLLKSRQCPFGSHLISLVLSSNWLRLPEIQNQIFLFFLILSLPPEGLFPFINVSSAWNPSSSPQSGSSVSLGPPLPRPPPLQWLRHNTSSNAASLAFVPL